MTANRISDKNAARYIKSVRSLLPCMDKRARKMICDLRNSVGVFVSAFPDASLEDITARFGQPEMIAADFAAELGGDYISKYQSSRKIKIAILAVLASIMVFIAAIAIMIAIEHSKDQSAVITITEYVTEYVTEQTEENP